MLTQKITLTAANGMHARPAGELVKLVKSFAPARVSLATNIKKVNAASMLSILSLGLKQGTEIEVTVEGGDEAVILAAVVDFISNIED